MLSTQNVGQTMHSNLEQRRCACSHALVKVSLAALDVVVQVVSESVNKVNGLVLSTILGVAGKQN